MKRIPTLLALAACLFVGLAQAQWQWKDKAGHTVFSDRPPPTDIPARNILKQPGGVVSNPAAVQAPVAGASAPGGAGPETAGPGLAAPQLSTVDKELADRKKQADAAAAAKVKAEEDRQAAIRAENCARARTGKALYDSGVRVAVTNTKGEREILDDAARAAELRRIQTAMDANCR